MVKTFSRKRRNLGERLARYESRLGELNVDGDGAAGDAAADDVEGDATGDATTTGA